VTITGQIEVSTTVKRVAVYMIPVLLLVFMAFIMGSGQYLKKPRGDADDVSGSLQKIHDFVQQENWEGAYREVEMLDLAWKKVVPRIQFSVERRDITDFERNKARMKGAIEARDKASASVAIFEANYFWESLGK
jgi:hypothetical protein